MSRSWEPENGTRSQTILFAEDDWETRECTALLLSDAGLLVDAVENGSEALQRFTSAPLKYNVLITDHDMPELDGLQLVAKLRDRGFRGKIIVVSGGLSNANAEAYLAFEVDHILSKPILSTVLIQAIMEPRPHGRGIASSSYPARSIGGN